MKRSTAIAILCLIFNISQADDRPKIVASASIFEDMARHLGGDLINTTSIVPIGGDPHVYEPTPSDASLVASADLILVNGLTFEGWINELIENSGTKAKVVTITQGIQPITSEKYKNAYDPHAWMDASNGEIYAQNITKALKEIDPENSQSYDNMLNAYRDELKALDTYIFESIGSIPENQRILVTSHDAFAYYGRRYGIKLSAIMGISTDAEAQTSDIIRVGKTIRESGIHAIFMESTINPKLLQQLARDNNVQIGGELFADSIGGPATPAHGYIEMLRHNTDVITRALSQKIISDTKIDSDDTSYSWILYILVGAVMLFSLLIIVIKLK